nr:sugar-binding domain-containing protein [uncultured Niameybacter sp.]
MAMKHTTRHINFNRNWKFCWGGDSNHPQEDMSKAYEINYDDSNWRSLDLPHDWSIEFDFNIENSLVGSEAGYLDGGIGWYRKAFVLPKEMKDKKVAIHFGGVYMDSTVYVNGKQVGKYPNGYMPFTYDITEYMIADGMTENTIAVKVVNEQPSSRWYSGSGIYRDVELVVTHPVHIVEYGTFITTSFIEEEYGKGKATVCVETEIKNASTSASTIKVRQTVYDYEGNLVEVDEVECVEVFLLPGEVKKVKQTMCVSNPKLWSIHTPNLYKMGTELLLEDEVVDTYESRWGFKWVKFDANDGFFLNGEWMKLKGVCMHHDQGALGAVANTRALERQMEIMQEMGANAIRVTHNPAADDLLRICDEKGLMVIDEAFDTWYWSKKQYDLGRFFSQESSSHPEGGGTVTWAEFDLKRMVKRGRNFPCIIKWSVGNEVGEATGDKRSLETIKNMKKWVAEIDPTRGITQGVDKFRFGNGEGDHEYIAEVQDTVGFNYAEGNYDSIHKKHPDWALYGSETSSATKSRGVYSHPDTIGSHDADVHEDYQQSSYDNDHVAWGATASHAWIQDRDRKFIAGQFIWTGFDYIGEPTPWHNTGGPGHSLSPKSSYFGIVDTAGFPKDDYYLYQSVWKNVEQSPMVHILPHWNWEDEGLRSKVTGTDGKIPLRVYSNAPHIELLINGVSYGTKSFTQKLTNYGFKYQQQSETSEKLYLEWRLDYAYAPGTVIEAIAKNDKGEKIAQDKIVTADKAYGIKLYADRSEICADDKDLSYITVDIVDANGNFVPTADNEVEFEIMGEGRIVGVDNGNPISHERYKAQTDGTWKRKAFNGKALVIVQSTIKAGSFTLKAHSKELEDATLTITTKVCEQAYTINSLDTPIDEAVEVGNERIIAFAPVEIIGEVGEVPTLPQTIRARYNTGISKFVSVNWETISKDQCTSYKEFEVAGTVEGQDLVVRAKVIIRGIVATQSICVATTKGVPPTLPEKVMAYYSDGTKEEKGVKWDKETIDSTQVGIVPVCGTLHGTQVVIQASVRVVAQAEEMKMTTNYAKQWTGSQFPAALASFTQDEDTKDCISAVNDTIVEFEGENPNRWTNYQASPRAKDWVGILFAEGGNITQRYIDTIKVGFCIDDEVGAPENFTIEYYVPKDEPGVPRNFGHVTEGDLADEGNWQAVEGLKESTHLVEGGVMQTFTFNTAHTYAIRLNMTPQEELKGIGITELEAYGKEAVSHDTYEIEAILVEGKNILDAFDEARNYTYKGDSSTPKVEVQVTNHARVTLVPTVERNNKITIEIMPENGDVTQTKVYTIDVD